MQLVTLNLKLKFVNYFNLTDIVLRNNKMGYSPTSVVKLGVAVSGIGRLICVFLVCKQNS